MLRYFFPNYKTLNGSAVKLEKCCANQIVFHSSIYSFQNCLWNTLTFRNRNAAFAAGKFMFFFLLFFFRDGFGILFLNLRETSPSKFSFKFKAKKYYLGRNGSETALKLVLERTYDGYIDLFVFLLLNQQFLYMFFFIIIII